MKGILFSIAIFFNTSAFASIGGVDGGGGVGVRCNAQPGYVELLDLHEGKMRGLNFETHPHTGEEAIALTASLLAEQMWNPDTIALDDYAKALAEIWVRPIFEGGVVRLDDGRQVAVKFSDAQIPLSQDVGQYHIMPNCRLVQIAYFSDSNMSLTISRSYWDQLDWLEKAALASHEIIYFQDRISGLENLGTNLAGSITSERARFFVSALFSKQGFHGRYGELHASNLAKCVAGDQGSLTVFYVTGDDSSVSFRFNALVGRDSVFRTDATFQGVNAETMLDVRSGAIESAAVLVFSDETNTPDVELRLKKSVGAAPTLQAFVYQPGGLVPLTDPQTMACSVGR